LNVLERTFSKGAIYVQEVADFVNFMFHGVPYEGPVIPKCVEVSG
jgi:hypothetical protein